MEKNVSKTKKILGQMLEIIIVLASYFVLFLGYRFSIVTIVAMNIPLIYMASKNNVALGGIVYAVAMGLSVLFDFWWGMSAVFFTLIPFIINTVCIRKKKSFWVSVLTGFVAELIIVGGALLYANYYTDGNLIKYITDALTASAENDPIMTSFLYTLISTADGSMSFEVALNATFKDLYDIVVSENGVYVLSHIIETIIPQLISMTVFYSTMMNYLISRLLVKWRKGRVVEIPRIENWQIPKPHNIYVSMMYILGLFGMMVLNEAPAYAALILYYISSYPVRLMGLASSAYFTRIWISNYKGRIAISVVLYFLIPDAMIFFGIIDSILSLRSKMKFVKIEKK